MPDDEGIENQWNSIKALYTDTAENTLGYHKPSQTSYQDLDRQIKRKARKDKRTYTGELANEAEQAAKIGNSSKVYKITKKTCGRKGPEVVTLPPVEATYFFYLNDLLTQFSILPWQEIKKKKIFF